jgi:anti-anti-sigma regulatory factor
MMRIEVEQADDHLTLRVAGRLSGACVAALEDCWRTGRSQSPARKQFIDLSDVTSIDKTGWRLLRQMHRDGVEVAGEGLATETILDQLMDKDQSVYECFDETENRRV